MASIQIGKWQTLPSEGGAWLVFDGDRLAVSGSSRLSIWRGEKRLAFVDALSPSPGPPRFAGNRVYWGPGFLDLVSGTYTRLEEPTPAVRPEQRERPHVYAWSRSGEHLLGSYSTGDPLHPVRVTLFNGENGSVRATLWSGSGLPPQAAWLLQRTAVVGFGSPRVFDYSGQHVAQIELASANVVSFDSTTTEDRLVAVDQNRTIALIDTATWRVLDRWDGLWLHGAVSPDGTFVAGLEPCGKLSFACLERDRFKLLSRGEADPNAVSLALTDNEIGTVGGGRVRCAPLRISR